MNLNLLLCLVMFFVLQGCKSKPVESKQKPRSRQQVITKKKKPLLRQQKVMPTKCRALNPAYILDRTGDQVKDADEWICYYNGRWKSVAYYIKGQKHGHWRTWFANGKMKTEAYYEKGRPKRKYLRWFYNGKKKERLSFRRVNNEKQALLEAIHQKWFSNGAKKLHRMIRLEGPVVSIKQFTTLRIQPKQKSKQAIAYNHGLYQEWHRNGVLKQKVKFVHNKKEGKSYSWYSNGQKYLIQNFSGDKLHGKSLKYFRKGVLREAAEYKKGVLHGEYKRWDRRGKLYEKGRYYKGSRCGEFLRWYKRKHIYKPCPQNEAQEKALAQCKEKAATCMKPCSDTCKVNRARTMRQRLYAYRCKKRCQYRCRREAKQCEKNVFTNQHSPNRTTPKKTSKSNALFGQTQVTFLPSTRNVAIATCRNRITSILRAEARKKNSPRHKILAIFIGKNKGKIHTFVESKVTAKGNFAQRLGFSYYSGSRCATIKHMSDFPHYSFVEEAEKHFKRSDLKKLDLKKYR